MQHTGQLEQQHESIVEPFLKLDLQWPHIDVGEVLQLLFVQVFKAVVDQYCGLMSGGPTVSTYCLMMQIFFPRTSAS